MSTAFVNPVVDALATAIENDATLQSLLAGGMVYSGMAPTGAPYDHVNIANLTDTPKEMFGLGSSVVLVTLDIWTSGKGLGGVMAVYAALNNLLHNKRLSLSNGNWMMGRVRLVLGNLGDQTDPSIVRGIVNYTVRACG